MNNYRARDIPMNRFKTQREVEASKIVSISGDDIVLASGETVQLDPAARERLTQDIEDNGEGVPRWALRDPTLFTSWLPEVDMLAIFQPA